MPLVENAPTIAARGGIGSGTWEFIETLQDVPETIAPNGCRAGGILADACPIESSSLSAANTLHAAHIRIVNRERDNRKACAAVAAKLATTDLEAEVLAKQTNAVIRRLADEGHIVAVPSDRD